MNRSIVIRGQFLDYMNICRAIFHDAGAKGIRMSFFNNCIEAKNDKRSFYPSIN